MTDLFRGLTAFRDDQHKIAAESEGASAHKVAVEGCVNKMALLDMSQLMWAHLRRGELCVAQHRCREASGRAQDMQGARQWWRASTLEGALFTFEPSQRVAFANSEYSEWYNKRYSESYSMYDVKKVLDSTAPSAPRLSPQAWLRYTKTCMRHFQAGMASLSENTNQSRPEIIRAGFDVALFGVLAGHNCRGAEDDRDSHKSFLDKSLLSSSEDSRNILRSLGVLENWEDELWLGLRALFTTEIKRIFEQSPPEKPLMSKICKVVESVEESVLSYEGCEGLAADLGRIQRLIIGMELPALVKHLVRQSEAAALHPQDEESLLALGLYAHVCVSLKVTLFLHGGQPLVDPQGGHHLAPGTSDAHNWAEEMSELLLGMDRVCKAYISAQIAASSWGDVPVTLRLMMNHFVREEQQGGGAYTRPFNEVLKRVEESNRSDVHELAVSYLQAVEVKVGDSIERRHRMDDLQRWLGAEYFQAAGNKVVEKFSTTHRSMLARGYTNSFGQATGSGMTVWIRHTLSSRNLPHGVRNARRPTLLHVCSSSSRAQPQRRREASWGQKTWGCMAGASFLKLWVTFAPCMRTRALAHIGIQPCKSCSL